MFPGLRVAVVVPAYREERLIAKTIRSMPAWIDRIVVVDDGSDDETASAAEETRDPRLIVHRHDENRGVGAAIATGYRLAFERGADIAVVMAGDAQMDPEDLPRVVAPVARRRAGYAKGDRLSFPEARQRMPLTRWLGNHVLAWLTRIATGLPVRDSQCGFTALSRDAAARVDLAAMWPRYGYPNDLLGALARADVPIEEVTVRPVYADEKSGVSLRDALFVIPGLLVRAAWRRWRRTRRALAVSS
ncbi:MAG: glycosyltransferase family 2 protein [Myxococcota bacterium]